MKIVIDISSLVYGTGVSVYAKELVKAIAQRKTTHTYVLFAGAWKQKQWFINWFNELNLPSNFSLKVLPIPPRAQLKLWNDWGLGKLEWLIGDFDLYHSLDWSLAPTDKPTVATVHDLFFVKAPGVQKHPYYQSLKNRLLLAKKRKVPVIAVSQTTARDLVDLIGYEEKLIKTVYEACPQDWHKMKNDSKLVNLKMRLGIEGSYILSVGTQEPRKNIPRLIQAFGKIKENVYLVLVGKKGWDDSINSQIGKVVATGYLETEDLMTIWSGAQGFVYPSLYEGFGLPILQSFVSEVPVMTSNSSSMVEVSGKAAIYVEPEEVDSIADGLKKLISIKEKDRERLISEGLIQAGKFSWDKAAEQTIEIYERTA